MTYRSPLPLPRRADRTLFPATIVGILVLVLPLQLMLPRRFDLPDAGVLRPFTIRQVFPVALPIDPAISAHAIFTSPYAAPGATAAQVAPLNGAVAAGMAARHGVVTAFLQAPSGTVTGLHVGDVYRGWRLTRASPSGLVFHRGGEQVILSFDGKPPAGPGVLPIPAGSQ